MAKETLVLDASVVVKWFSEEENSELARTIRDEFFSGHLNVSVPNLLFYEVANALRYNPVLTEKEKVTAVKDVYAVGFDVVDLDDQLITNALLTALRHKISFYDAVYIAVARQTGSRCVTADAQLHKKAGENFIVLLSGWKK
jgi:predicted nucleic acid-binding protein